MRERCGVIMKEYLVSVIGVCVLCFIVKQVSFEGDKKYISFICGLCALAVISSPAIKVIEWISSFNIDVYIEENTESGEEYESIFESYIKDMYADGIKDIIRREICERYSLDISSVEVYLGISENDLEKIIIQLTGKGVFANTNDIKRYLESKYSCIVEIIIGG